MEGFCEKCGAKINDGSKFCTSCGAELKKEPLAAEWFYLSGFDKCGPLTKTEISDKIKRGDVTADAFVWNSGMSEWLPVGKTELNVFLPALPPTYEKKKAGNKFLWLTALSYPMASAVVWLLFGIFASEAWLDTEEAFPVITGVSAVAAAICYLIFIARDKVTLYNGGTDVYDRWWANTWLILAVSPAFYLFGRAKCTDKNYAPAIIWCIVMGITIIFAL
ncbi:MAG: DUF4339 domain-containing protein [Clostridia bacterium]|nr:DUF4339 domain-containing protein [Clostridia bacterium]